MPHRPARLAALLGAVTDPAAMAAVTAERSLLEALAAGCSAPVAAYAVGADRLRMRRRHQRRRQPRAVRAAAHLPRWPGSSARTWRRSCCAPGPAISSGSTGIACGERAAGRQASQGRWEGKSTGRAPAMHMRNLPIMR
jgi:hypothetical protein